MNSPRHGLEALGATADVGTVGDVVEHPRERVEDRVDEADGALANASAVLVQLQTRKHCQHGDFSLFLLNLKQQGPLTRVRTEAKSGEAKLEP